MKSVIIKKGNWQYRSEENHDEIEVVMDEKEKAVLAMIVDGALKKLPTADLIAELERRRPCGKCKRYSEIMVRCKSMSNCVWKRGVVISNFKEATK